MTEDTRDHVLGRREAKGKACGLVNRRRRSAAAADLLQVPRSWKRTSLGG